MEGGIVQVSPNRIVYRASAIGGCVKALLAARLEYEPAPVPEKTRGLFASGHEAEIRAKKKLAGRGEGLSREQMEVELVISKRVVIVGHLDGLRGRTICEIKSQSLEEWDKRKRGERGWLRDRYDWQISSYMHALEMPAIIYWFNRDTGELDEEELLFPPISLKEIRARVLTIEKLAIAGVVDAPCVPSFPCPYFYLHDEDEEEYGGEEAQVVRVLAESYVRSSREEKAAAERKAVVRDALIGRMGESKVTVDGWKVTRFESGRVTETTRQPVSEFGQESTWEGIRVTPPKEWEG